MNGEPNIRITKHAEQRGEERLKLNRGALLRMTRAAMAEGMPMAEAKGDLWNYLESSLVKNQSGNMTRIHNGFVFVIHDHVLKTVYELPKGWRKQVEQWLAKNPPSGKSATSISDPLSGVLTPKKGSGVIKTVSNALKSPVLKATRPGGAV